MFWFFTRTVYNYVFLLLPGPTALAHHCCEGIHHITPTSVYDAHGIKEVPITSYFLNSIMVPSHPLLFFIMLSVRVREEAYTEASE